MSNKEFFPERPKVNPVIYAYEEKNPKYNGLLKIGYTTVDPESRIAQQYPILHPLGKPYKIVFSESAMYEDGSSFSDRDIHRHLRKRGFENPNGEWFRCSVDDLKASYLAVKLRKINIENRTLSFGLRPEQEEAINKTIEYFISSKKEDSKRSPKFLWNAKMRFGKTFTAYQLAKRMDFKRILVLTFKPAVEQAWNDDLLNHIDFEGWQFISPGGLKPEDTDKSKPIVCFGSFQDYLGVNNETGGIKSKNEWVHTTNWDIVIFDEYHYGAWRDSAKDLFAKEDEDKFDAIDIEKYSKEEEPNAYNETFLPITSNYYLYLSGTPFRAINSGEFIEDQIYNWTYSDEQKAKSEWIGSGNPYSSLPRMVLMTYRIPDSIRKIAEQGEFNEFDLNVFFSANGKGKNAKFVYENEVQKWLDLIRGAYLETSIDELKLGAQKPVLPFSDTRLLNILSHTLWFLPNVASCHAMSNLLEMKQNTFYHDYIINIAAGPEAGIGLAALEPVKKSMRDPLKTKTITLSCGKLTTGVTIKPWTGIFMLRNLSSPETYFQAAFRVQSPWELALEDNKVEVMKEECYVFDFALERALKQISDYSCRLNINETNPEIKVQEFIKFLPVLAFDGSAMVPVSAADILDIAMAGTSASLLARRWQSALLVNVTDGILERLLSNEDAMNALLKIEAFRSLRSDIETIINKSDSVKKAKKEQDSLSKKEKEKLTEDEKDYKSKRKQIQEKLIQFATRIPVFMYLSDFREMSLKDVITKLEPGLFKKVTGLEVKDFELLLSIGVFNGPIMNDAIYKFKRYEEASLKYTGVNKHEGQDIGLFDTVISNFDNIYMQKQYLTINQNEPQNSTVNLKTEVALTNASRFDTKKKQEDEQKKSENTISRRSLDKVNTPIIEKQILPENHKDRSNVSKDDLKKVKINSIVSHNAFGRGKIKYKDLNYIVIIFDSGSEKKFMFPSAIIQGFIKLENE